MNNISYSHRLKLLNLRMLELRRLHTGLIMTYTILNCVKCVNFENCLVFPYLQYILPRKIYLNCINI